MPALENEGIVVAEVLERTLLDSAEIGVEPVQKLWRFKLRVVKAGGVAGRKNILRGQSGATIEVYSNLANAPSLGDKVVSWHIRFEGDERTGKYWLIETVQQLSK